MRYRAADQMETVATPVEAESAPTDAAPQAAKGSRGGRRLLAAALLVALLMAVAGGAFAFANASLSSRYSPGRALLDYFAAQKRGDAAGMMANATFLRPAGSSDDLFQRAAVAAMLQIPQNSDVSDVRILSSASVDSSAVEPNSILLPNRWRSCGWRVPNWNWLARLLPRAQRCAAPGTAPTRCQSFAKGSTWRLDVVTAQWPKTLGRS